MTNNPLYDLIRTITGGPGTGVDNASASSSSGTVLVDALAGNTTQLDQLRSLFQAQIDATNANTQKLSASSVAATTTGGGSTAGSIAESVTGVVTGGFALNPIISGLLKLFGGGGSDTSTPAPLEKFALPSPVSIDAGFSSAVPGLSPADYGSSGLPRVAPASSQVINVQVSAMDSKSFLDRSEDIAGAVRRAMLESSSLNDVIAEL